MSPLDAPKPPPASYAAAAATLPPTSAAATVSDDAWSAIKNGNPGGGSAGGVQSPANDAFNMDGLGIELDDPFVVKATPLAAASATSPITTPLSSAPLMADTTSATPLEKPTSGGANVSAAAKSRSPEDFLGVNSSLVNLDSLVALKKSTPGDNGAEAGGGGGGANPFALTPSGVGIKSSPTPQNPFAANIPKGPPMNQLKNNNGHAFTMSNNNNVNNNGGGGNVLGGNMSNNNNFGGAQFASTAPPLMPTNGAAFPSTGSQFGFPSSAAPMQPMQHFATPLSQPPSQSQLQPAGDSNPFLL